jgi:type IV pilus assembly protein PilC
VAVAQGSTFHESLAVHPRVFSKLYTAMIKAGEESGGLSNALTVLASQMEQSDELTRKVKGAMIYPAIVVTAIVIVAILMLMFVVPTLSATFASLGADLPFATKVIVALSSGVTNHVFIVFGVLTLLIIGGISFLRSMLGKSLILKGALLLPVIGELVRETFAARAARTLASLLTSGVPVLQALSITSEVVGAPLFARVLDESAERVKKGDPLSSAFIEHPKLYPIMMSDMIAVGEETGKLSEMLEQVAAFYEGDVSQKTKDLSTIIEPILMLFIGGMVGVFAVAMVAPIYSLSSSI